MNTVNVRPLTTDKQLTMYIKTLLSKIFNFILIIMLCVLSNSFTNTSPKYKNQMGYARVYYGMGNLEHAVTPIVRTTETKTSKMTANPMIKDSSETTKISTVVKKMSWIQTVIMPAVHKLYFTIRAVLKKVLGLLQLITRTATNRIRHSNKKDTLSERQLLLGSSSVGLLAATSVGMVNYFQAPLASALQSLDLSGTPFSGVRDLAVQSLTGSRDS